MRVRAAVIGVLGVTTALVGVAGVGAAGASDPTCMGKSAAVVDGSVVVDMAPGGVYLATTGTHTFVWHGGTVTVCGAGHDTIDYSHAAAEHTGPVWVDVNNAPAVSITDHRPRTVVTPGAKGVKPVVHHYGDRGFDRFTGVDHVIGTAYDDHMITHVAGSTLEGRGGNDKLLGLAASVTLLGGDGNDHLTTNTRAAKAEGGAGTDACNLAGVHVCSDDVPTPVGGVPAVGHGA